MHDGHKNADKAAITISHDFVLTAGAICCILALLMFLINIIGHFKHPQRDKDGAEIFNK